MDFFDYSSAAIGMTYRNELNQARHRRSTAPGLTDRRRTGWEQVTGPQGSLTMVGSAADEFAPTGITSYYLDDTTPPVDAVHRRRAGARIERLVSATARSRAPTRTGCTAKLTGDPHDVLRRPGSDAAGATALRNGGFEPLTASALKWG